jgi:hypothetical protein
MRRNDPNILSHLALGNDGPHLSIDDNYVADFAIGNRGHRLCKLIAKGRSGPNSAAYATGFAGVRPRRRQRQTPRKCVTSAMISTLRAVRSSVDAVPSRRTPLAGAGPAEQQARLPQSPDIHSTKLPCAATNTSAPLAQCSLTCGSVRRVMSRASVSSATFVYPCSASSCIL